MKRSDFLALIPSISAIPLIGKDIVQKRDKIEIYQPEEMKQYLDTSPSMDDIKVFVSRNNQVIAQLDPWSLTITMEPVEDFGLRRDGRRRVTFEAYLTDPEAFVFYNATQGVKF